jgi:hypothetical protein
MLYGTSFVAARYAGIRDFLHAASADAVQTPSNGRTADSKPSPSEQCFVHLTLRYLSQQYVGIHSMTGCSSVLGKQHQVLCWSWPDPRCRLKAGH